MCLPFLVEREKKFPRKRKRPIELAAAGAAAQRERNAQNLTGIKSDFETKPTRGKKCLFIA